MRHRRSMRHASPPLFVRRRTFCWQQRLLWLLVLSSLTIWPASNGILVHAQEGSSSAPCKDDADCQNGGRCESELHGSDHVDVASSCACAEGFLGEYCQLTCPIRCVNGGQCRRVGSTTGRDDESDFECICPPNSQQNGAALCHEDSSSAAGAAPVGSSSSAPPTTRTSQTDRSRRMTALIVAPVLTVGITFLVVLVVVRQQQQRRRTKRQCRRQSNTDTTTNRTTPTTRPGESEIEIGRIFDGIVTVTSPTNDIDDDNHVNFVPPATNLT